MGSLANIRAAGFTVKSHPSGLEISPASKLTEQQRNFIKTHREEIIAELGIEQARARFSRWRIVCKGKKQEMTIIPPHTMDEMQRVYRGADLIEPLADSLA